MKQKIEPVKYCETCGKQLERKRYNGRLEDMTRYSARKYCCLSCANTRKIVTTAGLRYRAEQLRKSKCEICGNEQNLHAHHIDGNIGNNMPENIQTLCSSCHAKHHHLMRRLGKTVAGKAELKEFQ